MTHRKVGAGLLLVSAIGHPIHAYGYWAVSGAIGLESLGVPVPGETTLVAAALYASSTHRLNIIAVVAVASAAAIVGDNIGYLLGRLGGYRLLRRYGRYVRLDEAKIKVGRYLFDRHGGKVVFFGRFVSILRTYAAFLAGTNHMHWRRFLLYNATGGILWAALYGFGAYSLGTAFHKISTAVTIAGAAIAAVAIVTMIIVMRRQIRTLEQRAEEAYPGPLDSRASRGRRLGTSDASRSR